MHIEESRYQVSMYPPREIGGGMTTGYISSGIMVYDTQTGIGVVCNTERSQHKNREKAFTMLEILNELEDV